MKKPVDNFCKYVLPCGYCDNTGAPCKLLEDVGSNGCVHDWKLVGANFSSECNELEFVCKKCGAEKKEYS